MANKYIEHGKYPAYAAVPGWGLCQEGDGAANGLAVSAIASIQFNAADNLSGSVSIMGVSVSFTGGTSPSAQASSLAAAINASATAVNAGTTPNGTQLRDLVYARANATAGKVDIMTRAGSATLNYATNSAVLITHSLGGTAPTITQFAGGVSGSWGYYVSDAVLWPSGVPLGNYSVLFSPPLVGDCTGGDTVFVRTSKAGSQIYINAFLAVQPPRFRYWGDGEVRFIYNSGHVWPETDGRIVVRWGTNGAYFMPSISTNYPTGNQTRSHIGGICTDGYDEPNICFETSPTGYGNNLGFVFASKNDYIERVLFSVGNRRAVEDLAAWPCVTGFASDSDNNMLTAPTFESCIFVIKQDMGGNLFRLEGTYNVGYNLLNCTIRGIGLTSVTNGFLCLGGYGFNPKLIRISNLKLEGIPANSPLFFNGGDCVIIAEDTSLVNLEATQGKALDPAYGGSFALYANSTGPSFPFIIETNRSSVYWMPTKGQPTLNAVTPDGVKMSWCVQTSSDSAKVRRHRPVLLPKMGYFNQTADGVRTLTVNFLGDKSKTFTTEDIWMNVAYIEAGTGKSKSVTSRVAIPAVLAPIASLTPDWSQVKDDGTGTIRPFMTVGADKFYNRYQLIVTTPTPVKQNTAINILIGVEVTSQNATDRFVFCPEVLAA